MTREVMKMILLHKQRLSHAQHVDPLGMSNSFSHEQFIYSTIKWLKAMVESKKNYLH